MKKPIQLKGSFSKLEKFLRNAKLGQTTIRMKLERYGVMGVEALASATPVDTGKTADSWTYSIIETDEGFTIEWTNNNVINGWANVALLLQYGHATRDGGYVKGIDYINPALKPIFEKFADDAWKEVASAHEHNYRP